MRVLLCGGGTAGHVYPALAISEIIKRNNIDAEFAYVVTKKGIENDLVKYKKYKIEACGLKKKALMSNIQAIVLTLKAIKKSKMIIKEFKPDIVIGTGGYSCFPVVYAAHKLGIKTALHESNARPGKTAMMLSRYLNLIMLNYEQSKQYFKNHNNVKVVGVPMRDGFIRVNRTDYVRKRGITILCFGGSLGAEKINECALKIVEDIVSKRNDIYLIWGTGKREYEKCRHILNEKFPAAEGIDLRGYIDNIPEILQYVDIVICRAGAMSISEMAYNKKCAIFIPSPNVADDHQRKNAEALANKNAAIMITEDNLDEVIPVITELINNAGKRIELSNKISEFCNYESNKMIYNEIIKLM